MDSRPVKLYGIGKHPTLQFAMEELGKYLERLSKASIRIHMENMETYEPSNQEGIWLGLWNDFTLPACSVDDPVYDDALYLKVNEGKGIIAGTNYRSVLMGVYRFLEAGGCRWVRPGPKGEYIPKADIHRLSVDVEEKASYRHRGICIEGAVSCENVTDMIDWAPKAGYNGYFIQFREAYTFYERWYTHRNNPTKEPEPFSIEQSREYVQKAEAEIQKRGLLYHAVGHGWTCEPFGIPGLSWDSKEYDLSPEVRQYLAEVNGKREIWQGIPLNTNLCYSNPEVRQLIVQNIVEYLEEHKYIDILHFWLADGSNNQCECEKCRNTRPSDYYVMMLNDLDRLLTQRGITAKIVFLIYVDLLWTPEKETIQNPDRFILMFAPITRSYSQEFSPQSSITALPAYQRNKLQFPSSVDENVAFLKAWQKIFNGDSFDFDYHFMWDHYSDPGYYQIAQLLHHDIRHLKEIGLNGFVSCQVQRAFFPTGLGMYVMGKTLWNERLDFDALADDYFEHAFGSDGEKCRSYLSELSRLFDPPYLRGEKEPHSEEAIQRFHRIPGFIDDFKPVIQRNLQSQNPCHTASWLYLKLHADIATLFAMALEALAADNRPKGLAMWQSVQQYVQDNEDTLQPALDVFEFIETINRRLFRQA